MFTDDLKRTLAAARAEAHRLRHDHVRPEHLALGVLRTASPAVARILGSSDPVHLAAELEGSLGPDARTFEDPFELPYAPSAKAIIARAMIEARALGTDQVASEHLLFGVLFGDDSTAQAPFVARGIDAERVHGILARSRG